MSICIVSIDREQFSLLRAAERCRHSVVCKLKRNENPRIVGVNGQLASEDWGEDINEFSSFGVKSRNRRECTRIAFEISDHLPTARNGRVSALTTVAVRDTGRTDLCGFVRETC
jgi:hypothetical protein